ncbi:MULTISPECIES: type I glutamate--ammonia ligase [Anoxybacillus]|uniref:type I glutamate--ammonia ligase n=1 Tax=Anoxybacillus TaxID=150247 RepID=UPI0007D90524|nr:type I glutamate--ammonia ligase [Anoxybacillus flavithermus]MBE2940298.1 type I glutamate--ammonia ligase [Anoxybacillus flavithermus]MBE2942685.1 type I glutamate--ammonia ligase [Anoxybacillus flavithermus]MBE2951095.1 type I glutamate--ammonia ligase [Anoxybacillus flavithermus]MBE2953642.1 type I glutamate--ammonia ligase [Anoxybacillus flavithermus]MBE2958971.1 type I glutamate--ammonia ligase [Anoxybacillus flavithermus]
MSKLLVSEQTNTSTLEQIKEVIKQKHVELLHLQFVDIEGILKHVTVTAEQLDDVVEGKIMFDGSSIKGFSPINRSDLYLLPDLQTFAVLPWTVENGYAEARFLCSVVNPDGTLFEGDPRNVLKKTVERAKQKGYTISVGPELEFFLFETDENGNPTTKPQDSGGYFEPSPKDLGERVRLDIYRALKAMGFTVEASHHEVAEGQHEINFKYADALGAADNATTYKWVVKTIAKKYGLHATFMPKPIFGINGSGMHVNISLFKDGENAFFDPTDDNQLSETAYQFIAGLLRHVKSFAAITNPLVNSYKRLVPGYEAPCYIAWSASNRSALIRIPAKRGLATRVELRCPDPSANPYLAFAVIAEAGLDGVEKELTCPAPIDEDIFHMTNERRKELRIENLPGSLGKAIEELENGTIGRHTLGDHVFNEYVAMKKNEWDSYRTAVHTWEIEHYQTKF